MEGEESSYLFVGGLFAEGHDRDLAWSFAVELEEEDALPGAEVDLAFDDV